MKEVFGPTYADAYDRIYHDKNYDAECDLVELIFQAHGKGSIRSVLDLGCGTGNHAIRLAQRGYEIAGVDSSESMLAHAQRKAAALSDNSVVSFHKGDIRRVELKRHFDAVLMMFAVLGYQVENADVLSAMKAARRHMRSDGLLIFDVWYGPAVLSQRPAQRLNVIPTQKGKILRFSSGEIDIRRHICTVHFNLWRIEGERLTAETKESHTMRYFFPRELELFLECEGFKLIRLGKFPDFDQDPDEMAWNVLGVARAI